MTRFRNIGLLILLLLAGQLAAQVPVLDSLCSGAVRNYRVDGEAGSTYSWILTPPGGPAALLPSGADTLQMTWDYAPGTYELQAVQHSVNGCDAQAVFGQVIIVGQPDVFAGGNAQVCFGLKYTLVNATAGNCSSLHWETGGDGIFDNDAGLNPTYRPGPNDLLAGVVTLTLTGYGLVADGGCDPSVSGMQLAIVTEIIPEFNQIGPLCQYSTPPALPDTSLEGITGSWDPPVIITGVPGSFIYSFIPGDSTQCGVETTMEIAIVTEITPDFDSIGPLCQYTIPPALPGISLNGVTGTWNPPAISTDMPGIFLYAFTPDSSYQCALEVTLAITVAPEITPEFDSIGPLCQYSQPPPLPGTSLNGITGSWNPAWISTAVPGTFTFAFTPDDPGQCGVAVTMVITIIPEISPAFVPIGPLCQFSPAPALPDTSLQGIRGTWNPPAISTGVTGTFFFTFTPDDSYRCVLEVTIAVTIVSDIIPQFDPIGPLCQYSIPPALPGISLEGITGTWAPPVISTGVPGDFTYIFTPGDFAQCGVETTMVISIVTEITPEFDTIGPLCQFSIPPALPDTSLEGITGTWEPPAISTDLPGTFTYTFTPGDPTQCGVETIMEIIIETQVTPDFDPIGPLCRNAEPPVLPGISNNGITGSWEPPVINTAVPGTESYTFTPVNGQCAVLFIMDIVITDEITPEFDTIGPLCQNSEPPVLPVTSNNGITGSWEPPVIDTSVPGTATYTFNPGDGQCAVLFTMDIVVTNEIAPEFDLIGPLCQYSIPPALPGISLEGITGTWAPPVISTGVPGDFTYIFTPGDSAQCGVETTMVISIVTEITPEFDTIGPLCQFSIPPALPDTSIEGITGTWEPPAISTDLPGTFTYTFTPGDPTQCGVETIMEIIIETQVTPEFDPIVPICLNAEPPLLPSASNNGITGSWEPPVIDTYIPGTVTYTFTPDTGQCAIAMAMEIAVDSLPDVFAGIDQDIPMGTSTTIADATASGTAPLTYNWTPASLLLDPAALNPTTVTLTATTIFTLTVTDGTGCESSDEVTINVAGIPLQAITIPGGHCIGDAAIVPLEVDKFINVAAFQLKLSYNADYLLCEGYTNVNPQLEAHLTGWVDQAAGVITLQWQDTSPVTFAQQEIVAELVFIPKKPGQGQLDWYTSATESYFTDLDGVPISAEFYNEQMTIYDPPVIILPYFKTVCEGEKLTITGIATTTYPPLTYQWTYPDGRTSTTDPFFFNVTQANAGDYTLLATDSMGCTDQKTIRLVVSESPEAAFHGTDTLRVPLGYILGAGADLASYRWNTGDFTESITILTEGLYKVEMESHVGCIGIDSIYLLISEEIPKCLYIPNAFTPDNDGLNDTFKAVPRCEITFFRMLIFNRWGEELFESDDISIGWDGTKNGKPCPGDAYAYKIVYKAAEVLGGVQEMVEVGTVVIVR